MGNALHKYLAKQKQQRINKQENALYYQNGSEQHSPRSERDRTEHKKIEK